MKSLQNSENPGLKWVVQASGEGGAAGSKGAMVEESAVRNSTEPKTERLGWVDDACGEGGAAGSKGAMVDSDQK